MLTKKTGIATMIKYMQSVLKTGALSDTEGELYTNSPLIRQNNPKYVHT